MKKKFNILSHQENPNQDSIQNHYHQKKIANVGEDVEEKELLLTENGNIKLV
jgi:hypothetical protein